MRFKIQNPHQKSLISRNKIQPSEFKKIISSGKKITSRYLTFFLIPNSLSLSRFAFSVPKRLGRAVQRNRMRRILRELVRKNTSLEGLAVDGVWMVKENFLALNKINLYQQVNLLFSKVIHR